MNSPIKTVAAVTALTLALAGCAAQQGQAPVSRIDRVQMGDTALSCPQIQTKIAEMDKTIVDSRAAQDQANSGVNTASAGGTAAAVGSGLLGFVPIVGGLASAGVGIATGSAAGDQAQKGAQAMQDEQDARERKNTLVSLANDKRCGTTTVSSR